MEKFKCKQYILKFIMVSYQNMILSSINKEESRNIEYIFDLIGGSTWRPSQDLMVLAFLKSIYTTHRTRRLHKKILKIIYLLIKVEAIGSIMEFKLC